MCRIRDLSAVLLVHASWVNLFFYYDNNKRFFMFHPMEDGEAGQWKVKKKVYCPNLPNKTVYRPGSYQDPAPRVYSALSSVVRPSSSSVRVTKPGNFREVLYRYKLRGCFAFFCFGILLPFFFGADKIRQMSMYVCLKSVLFYTYQTPVGGYSARRMS
jgi:hypothetical protein